jgi:hypothetical protein
MRRELLIDREAEFDAIQDLAEKFKEKYPDVHAGNSLVVMVSPDYSATAAMHLAHELSYEGEMCPIICIDVPYPDEDVMPYRLKAIKRAMSLPLYNNVIFVEAGVIRGGNYTWLKSVFRIYNVITTTLFENIGSKFKSDVVSSYYDDNTMDLTFYYERYNKHWKGGL